VSTTADLARLVRGLWSGKIVDAAGLDEMTRWTPAVSFPPGPALRYERYGLGIGANTVEGVELLGHTGFIGAFALYAPEHDAILVGTHNESEVDRWRSSPRSVAGFARRSNRRGPRSTSPRCVPRSGPDVVSAVFRALREEISGALKNEVGALLDDEVADARNRLQLHVGGIAFEPGQLAMIQDVVLGAEEEQRRGFHP
jgi:CubicO group peptidase (beta-lactamase class C family)